jgi:hypothetical protein
MSVLFIQNWDIIQGQEDRYAHFVSEIYIPETTALGLVSVGGYYVEVGFGPRVVGVAVSEDLAQLSKVATEKSFKDLTSELKSFVYNYKRSVYEPVGALKREAYTIQKGVWKFNQYYDLRPGVREAYADFVMNHYLPAMEKIDYVEVTGGWRTVFGGFSEIIAEFTFRDPIDIGRLLNNEEFRRITLRLRNEFALNYLSRIMRSTERFDEPKWFRL